MQWIYDHAPADTVDLPARCTRLPAGARFVACGDNHTVAICRGEVSHGSSKPGQG